MLRERIFQFSALWRPEALLVALVLMGYPLMTSVAGFLDLDITTEASATFRLSVVVIALCIILLGRIEVTGTNGLMAFAFVTFWCLYLWRISFETMIEHNVLWLSGVEFLAYTMIFAVIPAFGAFWGRFTDETLRAAATLTIVLGSVACTLGTYVLTSTLAGVRFIYESRYYVQTAENEFTEKLNPILMGHLGVIVILALLAAPPGLFRGAVRQGIRILLLGVPFFIVIASASKGPLVALVIALVAWQFLRARGDARIVFMLALGGAAAALVVMLSLDVVRDLTIVQRFEQALFMRGADFSTSARLGAYQAAWDQFADHPLIGDTLATRHFIDIYPHNLFLEVLMAMGLMGLVPLLVMLALSVRACCAGLARRSANSWIYVIFIQQIMAAMVSGGLHQASWPLFAVLVVILDQDERRRLADPAGQASRATRVGPAGLLGQTA